MRYEHVAKYVRERPWAILPGTLEAILEVLDLREGGEEFSREELEARIAGGPGAGSALRIGSLAVLPLYGVISPRSTMFSDVSGMTSLETFRSDLSEAVSDDDVHGIVLDVNSPGGSTELLEETSAELRRARDVKPIIAVANTQMASAAYHLGSQASELYATPSGMVGSVGVYATHTDLSGAQEKAGVKTTLIRAGKHKVEGNPFEPLSDEARSHTQELVDAHYDVMIRDIAEGRRAPEATVRTGYGEGRLLDARRARSAGMIDGVQTFDATVSAALASGGETGAAPPALAAEEHETFSDAATAALRAVDGLVTDAEALRELTSAKREALAALGGRIRELLSEHEPASPVDVDLEIDTRIADARARLAMR